MDGIWKLRHPHCMYPVKTPACGTTVLPANYPRVCTREPESQNSAFCTEHTEIATRHGVPTKLKLFVSDYCNISKLAEGKWHYYSTLVSSLDLFPTNIATILFLADLSFSLFVIFNDNIAMCTYKLISKIKIAVSSI